jgi:hypothetical protein
VLVQCLDPGETRKLLRILPPEICALWPEKERLRAQVR